jgi:hypothetical protein
VNGIRPRVANHLELLRRILQQSLVVVYVTRETIEASRQYDVVARNDDSADGTLGLSTLLPPLQPSIESIRPNCRRAPESSIRIQ